MSSLLFLDNHRKKKSPTQQAPVTLAKYIKLQIFPEESSLLVNLTKNNLTFHSCKPKDFIFNAEETLHVYDDFSKAIRKLFNMIIKDKEDVADSTEQIFKTRDEYVLTFHVYQLPYFIHMLRILLSRVRQQDMFKEAQIILGIINRSKPLLTQNSDIIDSFLKKPAYKRAELIYRAWESWENNSY